MYPTRSAPAHAAAGYVLMVSAFSVVLLGTLVVFLPQFADLYAEQCTQQIQNNYLGSVKIYFYRSDNYSHDHLYHFLSKLISTDQFEQIRLNKRIIKKKIKLIFSLYTSLMLH